MVIPRHAILMMWRRLAAVGTEVTKGRMVAHLTIFAKHESKVSQVRYQALEQRTDKCQTAFTPLRAIEGRSTRSEARNGKSQKSGSPS